MKSTLSAHGHECIDAESDHIYIDCYMSHVSVSKGQSCSIHSHFKANLKLRF
jgi:hypothetical protein